MESATSVALLKCVFESSLPHINLKSAAKAADFAYEKVLRTS